MPAPSFLKPLTACAASLLLAALSSPASAALQGRNLDANPATFEAYYDTVLDITWLADTHYAAATGADGNDVMTWSEAAAWADQLVVNGVGGWRLPSTQPVNGLAFDYAFSFNGGSDRGYGIASANSELGYMFYVNLQNPSRYTAASTLGDIAETGCYSSGLYPNTCLENTGPFYFRNLGAAFWSGSADPAAPANAWRFFMDAGGQFSSDKSLQSSAWAVRDGDIAAVPEPATTLLWLAGVAGLAAWTRRGTRRDPARRVR